MDTQPWFFLIALVFLSLPSCFRLNRSECLFGGVLLAFVLYIGVLSSAGGISQVGRAVLSYFFAVFGFWGVLCYLRRSENLSKTVAYGCIVYITFGTLQFLVGDSVVQYLAPIRTTADRGVTSLAVEPTNLGFTLLILSWMLLLLCDYKPAKRTKYLLILNVTSIFVLAQSSMAILQLFLALLLYGIYKIKPLQLLLVCFIFLLVQQYLMFAIEEVRAGKLFHGVVEKGISGIIYHDASINSRVSSAVFPYEGLLKNNLIPGGFDTYPSIAKALIAEHSGFFWWGAHNKIMSYIGTVVYELGLVGLCFIFCFCLAVQNSTIKRVFESAFLFFILNSAVSLASPLVGMLLAVFYFTSRKHKIDIFEGCPDEKMDVACGFPKK